MPIAALPLMDDVKEFIEMLRDPNPGVRRFALQRLSQVGDRGLIPLVRQATQDPDNGVASQAEQSLSILLGRSVDGMRPRSGRRDGYMNSGVDRQMDKDGSRRLLSTGLSVLAPCTDKLTRLVESPNTRIAQAAVHALGKIGDPRASDVLAGGLAKESIAQDCALALGSMQDPHVVDILLSILDSPDRRLVQVVLSALDSCRDDRVIQKLVQLCQAPDPDIRADAVFLLGEVCDPSIIDRVLFLLNDPSELVVSRTIDALRKLNFPNLVETVVLRFADSNNHRIRATLLSCLLHHPKDDRVIALLESALKDSDARVRANAVEAVASLKIPVDRKLDLLSRVGEDSNNRVLGNLAIALGPLDSLGALRVLTRLLNSTDKWERASAVYAAGFIKETKVGSWLASTLMFEDDEDVIRNIIASLSRFRDPAIMGQLLKGLAHPKQIVRFGTGRILGQMCDRSARPALVAAIDAESVASVKAEMITALARLSDSSHVNQISKFLKDPDPRVQANTIDALDQIGSLEILPLMKPFLSSLDNRVKANAARALWGQGTLEVVTTLVEMLDSASEREVLSAVYALGEIGRTLEVSSDSHRYFILKSSLREKAREMSEEDVVPTRVLESQAIAGFLMEHWTVFERYASGQYSEALAKVEEILHRPSAHPIAYYLAGEMSRRLENFEKAGRQLREAEIQNAQFVGVLNSLANLYHQLGDTRMSVTYHLKAMRDRVALISQEVDQGLVLAKGERLDDASLLLKSLIDPFGIEGRIHRQVGSQSLRYGDLEKSFRHLFLALMEDPQDMVVMQDLAIAAHRLSYAALARTLAARVAQLSPEAEAVSQPVRELLVLPGGGQ
jgi:HEAT repeat protein